MSTIEMIDRIPGLRAILDKCQEEVVKLTGVDVSVYFRLKFHRLTTNELANIICEVCDVKWDELVGKSRKTHYVVARHLFCYFSFFYQKQKLRRIAEVLDIDHTSVIHARDKVVTLLSVNDELYCIPAAEIKQLIDKLLITKSESGK